ncbi:hypothetical protein [Aurantivibrio plasticivorans]
MNTVAKNSLAVVSGILIWGIVNFASLALLAIGWPELGDVGKAAQSSGDYSQFTLTMLIIFLLMWLWVNVAAGWLTALIAKHSLPVWVVVGLLSLFALYNHLFVYWDNLPNWYNIAVIVIFPPSILAGGLLAKINSR